MWLKDKLFDGKKKQDKKEGENTPAEENKEVNI